METAPVGAPVAVLDERNGATRRSMPEVASGSSFSVRGIAVYLPPAPTPEHPRAARFDGR